MLWILFVEDQLEVPTPYVRQRSGSYDALHKLDSTPEIEPTGEFKNQLRALSVL